MEFGSLYINVQFEFGNWGNLHPERRGVIYLTLLVTGDFGSHLEGHNLRTCSFCVSWSRPVQPSSRRRLSPSGQNSWSYDASGCNCWIGTNDALRWLAMILLKKRTWWRDGVSEMEGGVFVWVWIVCYCFSVFLLSHHGICFVQSVLVLWSKVWNLMIATAPKTSIAAQPLINDGWKCE